VSNGAPALVGRLGRRGRGAALAGRQQPHVESATLEPGRLFRTPTSRPHGPTCRPAPAPAHRHVLRPSSALRRLSAYTGNGDTLVRRRVGHARPLQTPSSPDAVFRYPYFGAETHRFALGPVQNGCRCGPRWRRSCPHSAWPALNRNPQASISVRRPEPWSEVLPSASIFFVRPRVSRPPPPVTIGGRAASNGYAYFSQPASDATEVPAADALFVRRTAASDRGPILPPPRQPPAASRRDHLRRPLHRVSISSSSERVFRNVQTELKPRGDRSAGQPVLGSFESARPASLPTNSLSPERTPPAPAPHRPRGPHLPRQSLSKLLRRHEEMQREHFTAFNRRSRATARLWGLEIPWLTSPAIVKAIWQPSLRYVAKRPLPTTFAIAILVGRLAPIRRAYEIYSHGAVAEKEGRRPIGWRRWSADGQ